MILTKKALLYPLLRTLSFSLTHYDALGLQPDATQQEIKSKYYQLAKKHHPDRAKDSSSASKFINIQQAYEVLSDQKKRQQYDASLHASPYSHTHQSGSYSHSQTYAYREHYKSSESQAPPYHPPSWLELLRENAFSVLFWCGLAYLFYQTLLLLDQRMTQVQMEQQRVIEMITRPQQVEKRVALYADQMKQKNIYGQLVELNMKGRVKSSKTMMRQKESLQSQQGIYKQRTHSPPIDPTAEQYM